MAHSCSKTAVSFPIGLFLICVAVASPMAALDHELLSVHMLDHLLLMTLAPPLIWFGAPVRPLYGLWVVSKMIILIRQLEPFCALSNSQRQDHL